jgi:exonuclease SbcD
MMHGNTPVLYSGSPLSYSLSEAEQTKSVTIVDLEKGAPASQRQIELVSGKKVHRKLFTSVMDAIKWLEENPNTLVELTIESDTYLTAEERKLINAAHNFIVEIIPVVKNANAGATPDVDQSILLKSVEELFRDYFKHKMHQEPNEHIMSLLREVMKAEEE